ncbi:hypothetical protein JCM18918_1732 [Cutibacterium acnes JCM 18918]|nr:hypothetical protein JCM18918_1732 [Cutibacterium acnes JCM 18918]
MLTEPIVADNAPGQVTLAKGIENLAASGRRRGMKVVVSDFLSPGDDVLNPNDRPEWERSLRRCRCETRCCASKLLTLLSWTFPTWVTSWSETQKRLSPTMSIPLTRPPASG